MDEHDVEAFYDALGGRPPRADADGWAMTGRALRQRLTAREVARAQVLDDEALRRRDALFARLDADGRFGDPRDVATAATSASGERDGAPRGLQAWWARAARWLADGLAARSMQAGLAAALVLVLAVGIRTPPGVSPQEPVRGHEPLVLKVDDPAAAAESLAGQLRRAGAEVETIPVNASKVALDIRPRDAASRSAVRALLEDRGLRAPDAGEFTLYLEATRSTR